MRQLLLATALALVATQAGAFGSHHGATVGPDGKTIVPAPVKAPELDPGVGWSAITLLALALAVMKGSRRT